MLRVAGSLYLSFLTGMAPPTDAPEVQRPSVRRPAAPEPAAPQAPPSPAPPSTRPQPPPASPSSGGPPALPPTSGGAAPPSGAAPAPEPSAPAPAAPMAPQPVAPAPAPSATAAPTVNWEDPATAPVMSGTAAPDPSTVQWETQPTAPVAPAAAALPPPQRPWARGIGMYVTSGLTFGVGLGFRIASSVNATAPLDSFIYSLAYNPMFATSLGLLGGARAVHAHQNAWDDSFGQSSKNRFVMPALGWGLFGAGMAVWLGTRFAGLSFSLSTQRVYTIWEAGYYLSLPLTYSGVAIGAYGSSYRTRMSRFRYFKQVTVAPMRIRGPKDDPSPSRDGWGLSFSGRF